MENTFSEHSCVFSHGDKRNEQNIHLQGFSLAYDAESKKQNEKHRQSAKDLSSDLISVSNTSGGY